MSETVHRVSVNFSDQAYTTLQKLAETQGKSMSVVLRDAIALEKLFHEAYNRGAKVLVEMDGRAREVLPR